MEKNFLYSIVVPVYNVEQYIQECINSLRKQTYQNIEVILVDDGSTDSSGKICDDNAIQDSRIKVIHKENSGVSNTRLIGVQAAKGEYVLCVDADDWLSEQSVEIINKTIVNNREPDVITYGHYRMTKAGIKEIKPTVPEGVYSIELKRKIIFPHLIQDKQARYYLPGVCGECFRRDLLLDNMISDVDTVIGEDMACTVPCIYHAKKVYVLNECLYFYRYNEMSATKGKKVFPWKCAKLIAEHLDRKIDLTDMDFQMQVYRYVVHMLFVTAVSQFNLDDSKKNIIKSIQKNLKDPYYQKAIKMCRFKLFSRGWLAHEALKHHMWFIIQLYNKYSRR